MFVYSAADTNILRPVVHNTTASESKNAKIDLTQEEEKYLAGKKEITVCDYANWMPYVGHDKGRTFGIIYDYYKAFEARIGVPIEFVHRSNMLACVSEVTEGKADVVSSLGTPNTFSDISLSDEYGNDFVALVTQLNTPFVRDVKELKDKKVAVIGHYKNMIAYLHQTYPSLKFQITDSTEDGLKEVANGKLYAFIDIYRIAAYNIRREHIGELKINTKIYPLVLRAHVGLRKEDSILKDIFNKAIADVSTEEKRKMIDQWMRAEKIPETNYVLIGEILLFALLVILWLLYRQFKERKRQESMLSKQTKLAGMGTMINNVAHQWRQPLNRINSNIAVINSILHEETVDRNMIESKMVNIKNSTQYMSDTIEDFSNYFSPNKVQTRFMIEDTLKKALTLMGSRTKDVDIAIGSDREVWVNSFEKEFQQVILIIMNNAIDNFESQSTADPKINITIREDNKQVTLSVQDNGGGIKEKDIDRIFEPYYTTKFANEGTGLGLYMAKMLIESSMGGHLSVKNVNDGACFEIKLAKGKSDA